MGPQLKVVERTRTATMLCAASGNPDPDISWFKDFLPVNTSNNNGRIKQLRSGNFSSVTLEEKQQQEPLLSFFLFEFPFFLMEPFLWISVGNGIYVVCVPSVSDVSCVPVCLIYYP